jgi:hypothetical protein
MSKTKELFMQIRSEEMYGWDAIDEQYFYQKYKESLENLSVCK